MGPADALVDESCGRRTPLRGGDGKEVQDIYDTITDVPFETTLEGETDNVYKQALRNLECYL